VIGSLSHDSAVMGGHNVFAPIQIFSFICRPSVIPAICFMPSDACCFFVKLISRFINTANICNSVVGAIVVDVIDNSRLLAVVQKPGHSVGKIRDSFESKANITVSFLAPCYASRFSSSTTINLPRQIARLRIVGQDIANGIRDNFHGHIAPPCGLVKGVWGATQIPYFNHKERDGTNFRER